MSLKEEIADFERKRIAEELAKAVRVEDAAKALGLCRPSFYKRLHRLGMSLPGSKIGRKAHRGNTLWQQLA